MHRTLSGAVEIPYSVRRSQRARRVRVTVDPARGVEVVLPRRAAERRVAELERAHAAVAARGNTVSYLGESLRLVAQPSRRRVHRRGDELLVPAAADERRPALERWYRTAARHEIAPRLDDACTLAGTAYAGLTIRGQRTRWASCSPTGAMSFNWRLLLAPAAVLEYVVWHEVCHLEVMDHSPRFWSLLASRCPDYRGHARWLRRYGATLTL